MICEPFINKESGEIQWAQAVPDAQGNYPQSEEKALRGEYWQPYAIFEREKLKELGGFIMVKGGGYQFLFLKNGKRNDLVSSAMTGYSYANYNADSESSRLIKRAEFLKAVCDKEGVEFLPKEDCKCLAKHKRLHGWKCSCSCHEYSGYILPPNVRDELGKGFYKMLEADLNRACEPKEEQEPIHEWKRDDCPYHCPRAAKLEKRMADFYYTKTEVDERIDGLIDLMQIICPFKDHIFFLECRKSFYDRFKC